MNHTRTKPRKRAANLSIDADLLDEAKELGIGISNAAEDGLRKAVSAEKGRRWKEENAEAIRSMNDWVKKNGIPLAQFRQF